MESTLESAAGRAPGSDTPDATARRGPSAGRLESRRLLLLAFSAVAALFFAANMIAVYRARQIRLETESIARGELRSINLASRMARNFGRERVLADEHIMATYVPAMRAAEARIEQNESDFLVAAREYRSADRRTAERLATLDRVLTGFAATEAPVREILALSVVNRDTEARDRMTLLAPQLDAVSEGISSLIHMDQAAAERALRNTSAMQRSATLLLVLLGLTGIALTALLGSWAMHVVHRREQESRRYSGRLEEQNRELDAFAGRVAHDLRGPLTTVVLAASRLSQRAPGEAGTTALLQRSVARMEGLIDDLLELSRIGAERAPGACDPSVVAAQLRDDLAPRLAADELDLAIDVAPGAVRCSDGRLRQVLQNLTDNAAKYRRPDVRAQVAIRGSVTGRRYQLRVSDNGIGMSPEEARSVFAPFYRAPRVRALAGTGLGLSIVKRVVDASGGTIALESRLGEGTTFVIELPLETGGG